MPKRVSLLASLPLSRLSTFAAFIALFALTGCNRIQVLLGAKIYLAKTQLSSMEVAQYKHTGIGPGEKSSLIVTFTQPDGKILTTEGKGKGKVLWADVMVTPTIVTVNKKGVLSLPFDPRVSDGKTGHVSITIPTHPDLKAVELDIPLRYNYPFVANFSGANGTDGSNGSDGQAGSSGSTGSMDPDNPSAGGDGGNGTDGSAGGDGSNGGDAADVTVQIALRTGAHPLLQVGVMAAGHKEWFYLVDPSGGTLTIKAEGGAGGAGGKGGKGGAGGSGGMGSPPGSNGSSGNDGMSGTNGSPGRSGSITVTYDPAVQPYLTAIRTQNSGAPKPTFTAAPVAPLW